MSGLIYMLTFQFCTVCSVFKLVDTFFPKKWEETPKETYDRVMLQQAEADKAGEPYALHYLDWQKCQVYLCELEAEALKK